MRRAWFAVRGSAFALVGRRRAAAIAASFGRRFDLRRGRFEWFLRIHPAAAEGEPTGHDRSTGS
jgi:hypothetical protein